MVFAWLLNLQGLAPFESAVLVIAWLVGLACGFLIRPHRSVAERRRDGIGAGQIRWSIILAVSWSAVILTGVFTGENLRLLIVAVSLSTPTAILYGFGKIGCRSFGCCGWQSELSSVDRFARLQSVEIVIAFSIAAITLWLAQKSASIASVSFFFIAHGLQRVLSRFARGRRLTSVLSIDSGYMVLGGLALWMWPSL